MLIIQEALLLLFAVLDAEFTMRRISEYGVVVEMNPAIRWLVKRLGVTAGVSLGVIIPTCGIAAVGWFQPEVLAFMLGVRFCLFLFQQRAENGKH